VGLDPAVAKAVTDSDDAEQHQQRQLDELTFNYPTGKSKKLKNHKFIIPIKN
jgi:hypothetical protein